jgi:hypothetical protein
MFRNNFVVSLKSGEKFFRENDDRVEVPFGAEYSIYLKNLNSRKAVVKVSIDGKNVLDGQSLVIYPNCVLELEGFMDGDCAKNKFKFIKMTKQIEDFRGITPEDGIIAVEYDFEKELPIKKDAFYVPHIWYHVEYPTTTWTYTDNTFTTWGGIQGASGDKGVSGTVGRGSSAGSININNNASVSCYNMSTPTMDSAFTPAENEGVTVKGDDVHQQFYSTYVGVMENRPTVVTLKMFGISKESLTGKPIYTKDKKVCPTCGERNKYYNKCCSCCGTRLSD